MQQQVNLLHKQLQETSHELAHVRDLALETVDMTGGPGWVHTIQNAVMQLDIRIDSLKSVMLVHQEQFEILAFNPTTQR